MSSRRGLLRRCADELGDLQRTRAQLRAVEADMAAVLGELGLSRLADIPALTAVGAAAILAETGDPRRYDSSSSLVKHAGLSPSDNASGAFYGEAHISRRGRPGLRLTVWRAVWPMLRFNPVLAAKYAAMTKAADGAAEAAAVQADAGSRQATAAAPRPAPGAPRPGSRAPPRCCAGSTPWSSTAPAGTPTSPRVPPPARRRPPDQRVHRRPPLPRAPETFLPDEGENEPAWPSGTTPLTTLGSSPPVARSFSPARLNAVGAGLPASRGHAEPACTT